MAPEPFVWGRGGSKKTPEQVAREREIADALMAQGVDFSPVQHPLQGLARVATAAAGAYRGYKADKAEQEGRKGATAEIAKLLSGGGGMPATGQPAANPTPSMGGDMSAYAEAIAKKESGGNYKALGPVLNSGSYAGDRAYGKYQVMGKNIPEWTQAALGRSLTPEEFLADPAIQDAVFNHRFGSYVQKYGNPQDAASAWFTGGPLKGNENKRDVLGTTAQNYVDSFTQNLGGASPSVVTGGQGMAPQPQGGGMADIAALLPALENPWLSDGQRMVIQAMLEQRMKAGQPVDPIEVNGRLVNPQTGQVVADFSDPKTATVGNALIDVRTGKPIYEAPAEAPKPVTLGEGGMLVDPATGQMIAENPKVGEAPTTRVIKQADGSEVAVQWDPKANAWMPMPAPEGGAAVRGSPKLTEAQSKDVGFYNRGIQAAERLETMESALLNVTDAAAGNVPLVGNMLTSADKQQADQAAREFLAVILRKDTGAAVTEQEFDIYGKMYIPRVGDSPEVLAQKREARKTAIESIRLGLGQVGDQVFGGQPVVDPAQAAPAATPAAPTASPAPAPDASSVIQKARDAIAKGADPEAVKKRLMDAGIDPSGL